MLAPCLYARFATSWKFCLQGKSSKEDTDSANHWHASGDVGTSVRRLGWIAAAGGLGRTSGLGVRGTAWGSRAGDGGDSWVGSWAGGGETGSGWHDIARVGLRGGIVEGRDASFLAFGPGSVSSSAATGRAGSDAVVGSVQSGGIRSWETLALSLAVDVSWTASVDAGKSAGVAGIITSRGGSIDWTSGDGIRLGGNHGGKAGDGSEGDGGELHFEWNNVINYDYESERVMLLKSRKRIEVNERRRRKN